MRYYFRVMLGRRSMHAAVCFKDGFIGTDFDVHEDLSRRLPDEWRTFSKEFIPTFLASNPGKSKIGAGLACGALWRVSKGIQKGDVVLCPDGAGSYRVGEVAGDYYYAADQVLPHRRRVRWLEAAIGRASMSAGLQGATGSLSTVSDVSAFRGEIEQLLGEAPSAAQPPLVASDPEIEDPAAFAMEQHLEEFLVANWSQTILGKEFVIYEEDGELVGQQYNTDAGLIDILAVSKDRKRLLVVELKRGRASDVVVGQILRYMGFVRDQIAEEDQLVQGAIIALDDDQKLRWALSFVPAITFYRYQVSFKLVRA